MVIGSFLFAGGWSALRPLCGLFQSAGATNYTRNAKTKHTNHNLQRERARAVRVWLVHARILGQNDPFVILWQVWFLDYIP